MKLNERAEIMGIKSFKNGPENEFRILIQIDKTDIMSHKILKTSTGKRYIKIKDYYLEGFEDLGKVKNFYIKDNLWWAVYKFEEYLKENDCAVTQSK